MGALVVYGFVSKTRNRERRRAVATFLAQVGFTGTALPPGLPLKSLHPKLAAGRQIACHTGTYKGRSAVVVETRIGRGKGSYCQSFVALKRDDSLPFTPPKFLTSLQLEYHQQDSWVLGTIDHRTMDEDAVKGFLECLS
jgi:hypothetical protein